MDLVIGHAKIWLLHGTGLIALGLAWACGHGLATIGGAHPGHEPALAYLLALITFLSASAGTTLAVLGPHLFRKVIVSDRWLPHVPLAFREQDKAEDQA